MATTRTRSALHTRPPASPTAVPSGRRATLRHGRLLGNPVETSAATSPRPIASRKQADDARPSRPTRNIGPRHRMPPVFTWERAFPVIGLTVGGLIAILFAIDLALALPFRRPSLMCDVGFLASGVLLIYLSFDVLRDQWRFGLR